MKQKMKAIEEIYGISSALYSLDGKMIEKTRKIKDDRHHNWLKEYTFDLEKINIVIHDTHLGAVVIPMSDTYLVLGNLFIGERNERRLWLIRQHMTSDEEYYYNHLPEISLSELQRMVLLLGDNQKEIVIMAKSDSKQESISLSDHEEEGLLENYRLIEKMMDCIQYGQPTELRQLMNYEKFNVSLRSLALQKQQFIQLSSLVSLSLFRGGLGIYECSTFMDYYLKQLEKANDEKEIHQLQNDMMMSSSYAISNLQTQKMTHPLTRKVQTYVQVHLHEPIDFKVMADEIGISKNYLLSQFKKEANQSLVDYVYTQKINEAIFLLHKGDLTIAQIAAYLGFSSSSYFITWFKKLKGQTPKEYMNK